MKKIINLSIAAFVSSFISYNLISCAGVPWPSTNNNDYVSKYKIPTKPSNNTMNFFDFEDANTMIETDYNKDELTIAINEYDSYINDIGKMTDIIKYISSINKNTDSEKKIESSWWSIYGDVYFTELIWPSYEILWDNLKLNQWGWSLPDNCTYKNYKSYCLTNNNIELTNEKIFDFSSFIPELLGTISDYLNYWELAYTNNPSDSNKNKINELVDKTSDASLYYFLKKLTSLKKWYNDPQSTETGGSDEWSYYKGWEETKKTLNSYFFGLNELDENVMTMKGCFDVESTTWETRIKKITNGYDNLSNIIEKLNSLVNPSL